jgi:CheY-like chemotaxis protein
LSDINLPGRKGIELLSELEERKLNIPIVFMTAFLNTYADKIPKKSNIEVIEKPISLNALRRLVNSKRTLSPDNTGLPFTITDYIQITCIGKYSVEILVRFNETYFGNIVIIDGIIWASNDQEGEGVEAFNRLIRQKEYQISCINVIEPKIERNITDDWEKLLLSAMIEKDDSDKKEIEKNERGSNSIKRIKKANKGEDFKNKLKKVNGFLLDKDYENALKLLLELKKIDGNDSNVKAKLSRLKDLGYKID